MEAQSLPNVAPQLTVEAVADFIGGTTKEVMESVRRLELRFEPSLQELTPQSLLFRPDIYEIRADLGYLTTEEEELRAMQAKSRRKEDFVIRGLLALVALFGLAAAPGFIGWLAGTRRWRGRTFTERVQEFWDLVVWIATSWFGKTVLGLAVLGVLGMILTVVWENYSMTPAEKAKMRRRRENRRRAEDDRLIAEDNLRRKRQAEWERRERSRRAEGN